MECEVQTLTNISKYVLPNCVVILHLALGSWHFLENIAWTYRFEINVSTTQSQTNSKIHKCQLRHKDIWKMYHHRILRSLNSHTLLYVKSFASFSILCFSTCLVYFWYISSWWQFETSKLHQAATTWLPPGRHRPRPAMAVRSIDCTRFLWKMWPASRTLKMSWILSSRQVFV